MDDKRGKAIYTCPVCKKPYFNPDSWKICVESHIDEPKIKANKSFGDTHDYALNQRKLEQK